MVTEVMLDLEFRPPWNRPSRRAGDAFPLLLRVDDAGLPRAATEWDADVASYPDGLG